MSRLALDPAWIERLRARADQPPAHPRLPLWAGGVHIGSVEPAFFERLGLPPTLVRECTQGGAAGWEILGELTGSLHEVAHAMRAAGAAHAWRDEQLAVTSESGEVLGTVERAAVRPLGITTFAVHLAAFSPDGRHWVQQRSLAKPNDPGLWDTLMGGMVPACDSLEEALRRETWEEAGVRIADVDSLRYGGRIPTRRPTGDVRGGYVVEHIDWFTCVLPPQLVPQNQDGEVEQFALLRDEEVAEKLLRDEFTLEAAAVIVASAAS